MALPHLQDYLPGALDFVRDAHDPHTALDRHEQRLAVLERQAADLRQAIDRFLGDLEELPGLTEDDLAALFDELGQGESRLKARLLASFDREAQALRFALAAFESGRQRLLVLRDKLLVREGQEMSLPSFWGDDAP
jgi:hypothetical protein